MSRLGQPELVQLDVRFGPDPALRTKCIRMPPVVITSGSLYVAQTKITTYKICTTIQNGHSFPVKGLQVRDTAPSTGETTDNKDILSSLFVSSIEHSG